MNKEQIKNRLLDSIVFESHMGISNEILMEQFGEQLKSGKVVLIHVKETGGMSEMVDCYFAQARNVDRGKNLDPSVGSSAVRGLASQGKWGASSTIIRYRDTLTPENIQSWGEEGKLDVGDTLLPEIAVFMYQDTTPDSSENYTQSSSRVTRDDVVYQKTTNSGQPIYEHTYLDFVEETSVLDTPLNYKLKPLEVPTEEVASATPSTVVGD